jgi:hypothetical protein
MFGYTTNLRSSTQGRASSSMELDHYADVPHNVAEAIIAKNAKQHPIVATVHNAVEYREIPHSLDPHHHKFALEGEALTPHDAVTAILQLADLSW